MNTKRSAAGRFLILGLLFGVILPIVFRNRGFTTPVYIMMLIGIALLVASLVLRLRQPKG